MVFTQVTEIGTQVYTGTEEIPMRSQASTVGMEISQEAQPTDRDPDLPPRIMTEYIPAVKTSCLWWQPQKIKATLTVAEQTDQSMDTDLQKPYRVW